MSTKTKSVRKSGTSGFSGVKSTRYRALLGRKTSETTTRVCPATYRLRQFQNISDGPIYRTYISPRKVFDVPYQSHQVLGDLRRPKNSIVAQSTYIYRVQRSVWRLPNYPPLHPASVSSPRTNSPGGEGVGVNISEDARHWIGLLQYNPSTNSSVGERPTICNTPIQLS